MTISTFESCVNRSGLRRVWINELSNVTNIALPTMYDSYWKVGNIRTLYGVPFKQIFSLADDLEFVETPQPGENGTVWQQSIKGFLPHHLQADTNELDEYLQKSCIVIFEDRNGDYRVMGKLGFGAKMLAPRKTDVLGNGNNGTEYTITFNSDAPAYWYTGEKTISDSAHTLTTDEEEPPPVPFAGIIDGIADVHVARSIARRLSTAYTGPLIQVRNAAGTLLDIGYDANHELDESALLAHCGAGSGWIQQIYDQSGNNYHLQQTTTTRQFKIVNSGVVITDPAWGKPAGLGDDTLGTYYTRATTPVPASFTLLFVGANFSSGYGCLEEGFYNWVVLAADVANTRWLFKVDDSAGSTIISSYHMANPTGIYFRARLDNVAKTWSTKFRNGGSTIANSGTYATARTSTNGNSDLGTYNTGGYTATGYFQEEIMVGSDVGATQLTDFDTNMNAFYGV